MKSGNTDEEKSSTARVDFHSLKMRTAVSPKRNTGNRTMRGPLGVGLARSRSFREEQKKDLSLSEGVRLSERFQSIERIIYGIGFTCVVVMGINRDTKEVRTSQTPYLKFPSSSESCDQMYYEVKAAY